VASARGGRRAPARLRAAALPKVVVWSHPRRLAI